MEGVTVKTEPQDIMTEQQHIKIEPQDVKLEPLDIKIEPGLDSGSPSKKKKKAPGQPRKLKQEKITDHVTVVKKKRDRFKGMSEEEVASRLLPDHLAPDLDIVIVGINPGLFAAYVGHHYAGPGNHFWKCMYLSGLIPEPMNAMQDYKLLDYGIGFTNIVARTTKGSADLTRKEIKEGAVILTEKLLKYKPKIAVFNGKGIYEIFVGHKNFYFGKQPEPLPGTETAVFVMPSSSARCSQLPRAVDKVPFYEALKKYRDHLNGKIPSLEDSEVCFPDLTLKTAKKEPKTEGYEEGITPGEMEAQINQAADSLLAQFTQGNYEIVPHVKTENCPDLPNLNGISVPQIKQEPLDSEQSSVSQCSNSSSQGLNSDKTNTTKKKRGRPPKVKPTLTQSVSSSSLPTTQQSQSNVPLSRSLSFNSLSNHSQPETQSPVLPHLQQVPDQNAQTSTTSSPPVSSTQSPSQVNCVPFIKQEPQDVDFSCMPKLQQFPTVKREPEDFREPSCSQNQSTMSSFSQYLNADQSGSLSQNGNNPSDQSNSFLQGLYGMVNKVANQQQSNYGMVNLTGQTFTGGQPLQFNDALCGIVKEGAYEEEEFSGPVIKTEPGIENMAKPKPTRKRKSNSKPSSTVTSADESKPKLESPSDVPTNESYPQLNGSNIPISVHSHPSENHMGQQHISGNPSYQPNAFPKHPYPPYPGQIPQSDYQHYTNGFNHNSFNPSNHFRPPMPSFSQMMAQDLDSFGKYQYSKEFSRPQIGGPFSGVNGEFSGHGFPYPYSQQPWGHPTNPPNESSRRMSADTISQHNENINDCRLSTGAVPSQAFQNTAMDTRLNQDKLDEKIEQEYGSFATDVPAKAGIKEEKLD